MLTHYTHRHSHVNAWHWVGCLLLPTCLVQGCISQYSAGTFPWNRNILLSHRCTRSSPPRRTPFSVPTCEPSASTRPALGRSSLWSWSVHPQNRSCFVMWLNTVHILQEERNTVQLSMITLTDMTNMGHTEVSWGFSLSWEDTSRISATHGQSKPEVLQSTHRKAPACNDNLFRNLLLPNVGSRENPSKKHTEDLCQMIMGRQILWKASLLSHLINCSHSLAKYLWSDLHTTHACENGFPFSEPGRWSSIHSGPHCPTRYLPFSRNTQGGLKFGTKTSHYRACCLPGCGLVVTMLHSLLPEWYLWILS